MIHLHDYRDIVGDEAIAKIYRKAELLYGKRILHINSTYMGGGVAEILTSLVPLMNDVGLDADWRILKGNVDLFNITKKFHNALQGEAINLSAMKKDLYIAANRAFAVYALIDHDAVIVHDPQPLPLIAFYKKRQPWIWRCHIDLSNPNDLLWDFLKGFILRYNSVIVSHPNYKKNDLPLTHRVIAPVIDPLTPKNMVLGKKDISKYLKKFGVPTDRPVIAQISRFDKWKDPLGVIEIFKQVREKVPCRLVLCGSMASDDPEGIKIFYKVKQKANSLVMNGDIILLTIENNILVNALQSISAVIIQKSLREGFGLTVTEALWKGKPVVASNVGGIPLQIKDGKTGFLLDPDDIQGFADRIVEIMKNPNLAKELGKRGRDTVQKKFLITRLLSDYLDLITEEIYNGRTCKV